MVHLTSERLVQRTAYINVEEFNVYDLRDLADAIIWRSGREEKRPVELCFERREDFDEFGSCDAYSIFAGADALAVPGSLTDARYIEIALREKGHAPVRTTYLDGVVRFEFEWIN